VLGKRVVRRIFGQKRNKNEKVHYEEPRNLYSSPGIIRVIKPKRMGLVLFVACVIKTRDA
jgi:hypothetical protein